MPQDIRNLFAAMAKKSPASSRPSVRSIESDEDVVAGSPMPQKKKEHKARSNKRKIIDSDSDDEPKTSVKRTKSKEEHKPVSAADMFGTAPVRQKKSVNNEKFKKALEEEDRKKERERNEKFQKTLEQLDDDDFEMDVLNQTLDDVEKKVDTKTPGKGTKNNEEKTPAKGAKRDEKTPRKSKKVQEELNESGLDPDEERHERRRYSAAAYQQYLNRPKPAQKGKKEMPKGKPDCLKGLCFLKTGVLDSLEHEDFDGIISEHGGRTVSAVSKKVNYLVVGEQPGPAKIEKAHSYGIKQITEDELLDLILTKSGMKPKYAAAATNDDSDDFQKIEVKKEKSPIAAEKKKKSPTVESRKAPNLGKLSSNEVKIKKEAHEDSPEKRKTVEETNGTELKKRIKIEDSEKVVKVKQEQQTDEKNKVKKFDKPVMPVRTNPIKTETPEGNVSWTDKYKPMTIKSIIGQQGEKSNMNRLLDWLRNWHKNHAGKDRPKLVKPSPWAKNDDGSYFKCALLSGPPGIGKTTTATLVARHLGFDVVEMNASDTRSKKMLHEEVSQLLSTKSISAYFKDGSAPTTKHVLLMDEVDGMAGNEDRGGIQELIGLIKNTQVPIICMCNDRQHQKMRTLVNYCMDLRFIKPKVEQIKGAMMSVCFKEKLTISPQVLTEIITATGMDIRQTLNNLSMWSSSDKNITHEVGQKESKSSMKDTPLGPWEVIRKVFSEEEHKKMSIGDRSRLFFYDYSIGPLFVQENYLQVVPRCGKKEVLERVAAAADAISMGDVIEKKIRSTNNWSLLESQAMYSSVLPGHYMEGYFGGQINFPSWLGKNSKRTKFNRLSSELQAHMRTCISGSKLAVNLDYVYHLRNNIVTPLAKEATNGVEKSIRVMKAYHLLREDLDSILELCQWPKQKDPMAMVQKNVKAAFTRMYNKESPALPYSTSVAPKKKAASATQEENMYGDEEGGESEDEENDDISKDAMIKEKKKTTAKDKKKEPGETTKKKPSTRGKKK